MVKKWADDEIKRLREKNDQIKLSDVETAGLRGEIAALKRLIDLPDAVARKAQTPSPAWPGDA